MFKALCNQLIFPLRQCLPRLRPDGYRECSEESSSESTLPESIATALKPDVFRRASFYAWALQQLPWEGKKKYSKAIDLGSKNFFYAASLYFFIQERNGPTECYGLEVDTTRLYTDFFRRQDYADYYIGLVNDYLGNKSFII